MSQVRSQNPFALLGEDGDESPAPAPKPSAAPAPAAQKPIVGARQPQKKAKNQADKREINADAPVAGELKEDRAASFGARGGRGRGSGRGRGNPRSNAGTYLGGDRPRRENGGGRVFDRQSQTGHKESDKNETQGWGAEEGKQELEAEKLGEADAEADGAATPAADGASTPAPRAVEEEEDNSQTYEEYLAAQAERKLNIALPKPREIEGAEEIKGVKAVKKGEEEEEDFLMKEKKEAKAPKERKTKQLLEVDFRHAAPKRDGDDRAPRGGRGGARGGRGRGEGRGRGGRGGARGGARGGSNGSAASSTPAVNFNDDAAFPTL